MTNNNHLNFNINFYENKDSVYNNIYDNRFINFEIVSIQKKCCEIVFSINPMVVLRDV